MKYGIHHANIEKYIQYDVSKFIISFMVRLLFLPFTMMDELKPRFEVGSIFSQPVLSPGISIINIRHYFKY